MARTEPVRVGHAEIKLVKPGERLVHPVTKRVAVVEHGGAYRIGEFLYMTEATWEETRKTFAGVPQ